MKFLLWVKELPYNTKMFLIKYLFRSKLIYCAGVTLIALIYFVGYRLCCKYKIDISLFSYFVGSALATITVLYGIRQYESQKKHSRISKAAELAKTYAEELVAPMSYIIQIIMLYEKKGTILDEYGEPLISRINLDEIKDFDKRELLKIFNEEEISKVMQLLDLSIDSDRSISFHLLISKTLNKMEYFCINFNSGIAEDLSVYQSLHQTFFEIIKYAYIFIAVKNTKDEDKYYTNIAQTHLRWREIYNRQRRRQEKIISKYNKKVEKESTRLHGKRNRINADIPKMK